MKFANRSLKIAAVLTAAVCAGRSSTVRADVLSKVPADALVVEKFNHLDETNTKVADLLQQLGVTDLDAALKNPIEALEAKLGVGPGLDVKRDAAAVLLNGDFSNNEAPFVILIPVSDYKAFIGSTTLVRTDGDVSIVHFKDNEDDVFIADWGDYAALGHRKEDVLVKHEGLTVTGKSAKELAEKDVCVYVNFPVLKKLLLPKVKDGSQDLLDQAEKMGDLDESKKKLADVAVKQGVNVVTEFLNDAQGTTIGMTIGKNGISSDMIVELTPDSYLGKLTAGMKSTDQPLMVGLPKLASDNYLFYGGSVQDKQLIGQVVDDVMKPVIEQLDTMGADGEKIKAVVAGYKDMLASADGNAAGVIAPTAALGQGSLFRMIGVTRGDAEKIKAAGLKLSGVQADLMKTFATGPAADMIKTTITPAFKTVDGVKFDKVSTEIDPNNTSMEATRAAEAMSQIYGPDGVSLLEGVVDPKSLVTSLGNDDELLGHVVEAVKAGKDDLTPDVKAVDAELPKSRAFVGYVAVDQIVSTVLSYARANGLSVPVQLPNNLPPIGLSAGTDGPTMRFDAFVPNQLLQSLVQAGMQTYMHFNQKGGGGV